MPGVSGGSSVEMYPAGGTDNKGTRSGHRRAPRHGGFIGIDRFGRFTVSQRVNLVGQHAYGFRVDGDPKRYLVFGSVVTQLQMEASYRSRCSSSDRSVGSMAPSG
jgi:hypothetical protein